MPDVSYSRVNWEDSPSTNTPISAANLNIMDKGISDCATEINNRQPKTDNNLNTTAKTIAGAINELDSDISGLNADLSDKVERMSDVAGYQTVDVLGYNPTTKELGLKVNGADTVIPFSGGFDDVFISSIRLQHSANSNDVSCRVIYFDGDGVHYTNKTISGSNYASGSHTITVNNATATITISSGSATSSGTSKNGTSTTKNGYTSWTGNASYSYDVVLGMCY